MSEVSAGLAGGYLPAAALDLVTPRESAVAAAPVEPTARISGQGW
ncbi:hypothetical protein [Candidatus Thiosymbion oneisti]|nr:hypothetical protein [Candidatus Thiosymbion oneisti]